MEMAYQINHFSVPFSKQCLGLDWRVFFRKVTVQNLDRKNNGTPHFFLVIVQNRKIDAFLADFKLFYSFFGNLWL